VVYEQGYPDDFALQLFEEAQVLLERFSLKHEDINI
jgi:hypothetical protein